MFRIPIVSLLCVMTPLLASAADPQTPLQRIAFGSCCNQNKQMWIWEDIVDAQHDVFLMIGDNIYGDSDDLAVLKSKWDQLGAVPKFQELRANCPVLATWDDHDYGKNDAGAEFAIKKESQQLFLDVFGEPADSPRRKQEGVYWSYLYGPEGKRTQIILLDTRYHRSPLKSHGIPREKGKPYYGPYTDNTDTGATVLGETQWAWLKTQLEQPADLRIIASSIQVLPNEHQWEKWGNFPAERERLFRLLRETKANGVLLISGDRHHAEISRNDALIGYPLYDVTSSSLNQPGSPTDERNAHRKGEIYRLMNFGVIEIDWDTQPVGITLQIRDLYGKPVLSDHITLSELQPK
ncbi:alkaline phosphatase family protein [bacterium]|nr:alkaline phosphatase family protein [bacterium]